LQIARAGLPGDRTNVYNIEPPGFRQMLAQFVAEPRKPRLFIGARTICRAFQTCINKLEIEGATLGLLAQEVVKASAAAEQLRFSSGSS
jgi:hypothetical protein